jgi:hypothetical protein
MQVEQEMVIVAVAVVEVLPLEQMLAQVQQ